jgi:hypothetical protein
MIDPDHNRLSIRRQCELVSISRASFYRQPAGETPETGDRRSAMTLATASSRVDNIRRSLVSLKMPRALEMLDATLRRIEQDQIDGIKAIA